MYNEYLNNNKKIKKKINNDLYKKINILLKEFKTILIINSYDEQNNILIKLFKKFKINAAYLTTNNLCYNNKHIFFNNENLNIIKLYNVLKKISSKKITHIIFNFSINEIKAFYKLKFDYCIINDFNLVNSQELKIINALTKNISKHTLLSNEDALYNCIKKRNNFITIGKNGNYKIINVKFRNKITLINIEHQYNKYFVTMNSNNPYIIKCHLLYLIILHILDYEFLDIIKYYKRIIKKRLNN